jgi:hypothetical protein
VSVDPRIELLSVVLKFSGYGDLYKGRVSDGDVSYVRDVAGFFSPCAQHEATRRFREFNATIAGDLPVTIAVHLSDPPDLKSRVPLDKVATARAGGAAVVGSYADALREFAGESGFAEFYAAHRLYYDSIVAPAWQPSVAPTLSRPSSPIAAPGNRGIE